MDKSRSINTFFWSDTWIIDLEPVEKLLYLYLLTNQNTNLCGVYELHVRKMAFETGIDLDVVERTLTKFEQAGKILYRFGYVFIKNFTKNQKYNGKMLVNIRKTVENLPKQIHDDTLCKGYIKGIQRVYIPFPEMEMEMENEIEKEIEIESKGESENHQKKNFEEIKDYLLNQSEAQKLQMFLPFKDNFKQAQLDFVDLLVRAFLKELIAKDDVYRDRREYRKYFVNWMRNKINKDEKWTQELYQDYKRRKREQQGSE